MLNLDTVFETKNVVTEDRVKTRPNHKLSKIQQQYARLVWPASRGTYKKAIHGPIGVELDKVKTL